MLIAHAEPCTQILAHVIMQTSLHDNEAALHLGPGAEGALGTPAYVLY